MAPSASHASSSPSTLSRTGPCLPADTETRPAARPSSTASGLTTLLCTQVVGAPGGASDPGRCQSLPPIAMAPGCHASHQASGVVQCGSSQLQCQTSRSGGRLTMGAVQLTWPPYG